MTRNDTIRLVFEAVLFTITLRAQKQSTIHMTTGTDPRRSNNAAATEIFAKLYSRDLTPETEACTGLGLDWHGTRGFESMQ